MDLFGLNGSLMVTGEETIATPDYDKVHNRIAQARTKSLEFLKKELELL